VPSRSSLHKLTCRPMSSASPAHSGCWDASSSCLRRCPSSCAAQAQQKQRQQLRLTRHTLWRLNPAKSTIYTWPDPLPSPCLPYFPSDPLRPSSNRERSPTAFEQTRSQEHSGLPAGISPILHELLMTPSVGSFHDQAADSANDLHQSSSSDDLHGRLLRSAAFHFPLSSGGPTALYARRFLAF